MPNSMKKNLTKMWKMLTGCKSDDKAMETLTSYIKDAEHEELSVITALKAHIDLMHDEQVRNNLPVGRFEVLNRSIFRLIADIESLSTITEHATSPQSKRKLLVEDLIQEIAISTKAEFADKEVSLSWDIDKGTILVGEAMQMKHMLTEILFTILHKCKKLDNIEIKGKSEKKLVTLTFNAGIPALESNFKPWRLGELRTIPTNGDGIGLATVDAMARLQNGRLSITSFGTEKQMYKLVFNN